MPGEKAVWSTVSGYVLAGGRSSRMGEDKAFVRVDGVELIEHAVRTLHACCDRVRILSGPRSDERDAWLSCYEDTVLDAEGEHQGPLEGLIAAMEDAPTPWVVLLAVDQPGVSPAALELLLTAAQGQEAAAACFVGPDGPEPLPLVARQDLLPYLMIAAATGKRRLFDTVVQTAHAIGRAVAEVDTLNLPAGTLQLANLNTPADLEAWREQADASNQSARRASE